MYMLHTYYEISKKYKKHRKNVSVKQQPSGRDHRGFGLHDRTVVVPNMYLQKTGAKR